MVLGIFVALFENGFCSVYLWQDKNTTCIIIQYLTVKMTLMITEVPLKCVHMENLHVKLIIILLKITKKFIHAS